MAKKSNPTKYDDFLSKIKELYIELPDYHFHHSASEVDNKDERFIGRKKLKEKLTNILSNSTTKTGAYLITGYRGMGKSSFVNEVLREVSVRDSTAPGIRRWLKILLVTILLFPLLDYLQTVVCKDSAYWPYLVIPLSLTFFVLFLSSLLNEHLLKYQRNNKGQKRKYLLFKIGATMLTTLKKFVVLTKYDIPRKNLIVFLQDLLLIIFIQFIYYLFSSPEILDMVGNNALIYKKLFWVFCICIFYILLSWLVGLYWHPEQRFWKWVVLKKLLDKTVKYLNFQSTILIKINLGHDVLREIDILRLISKNVQYYYSRQLKITNFKKRLISLVAVIFASVSLTNLVLSTDTIKNFNQNIISNSDLNLYFPSQTWKSTNSIQAIELYNTLESTQSFSHDKYRYCLLHMDTKYNQDTINKYISKYLIYSRYFEKQQMSALEKLDTFVRADLLNEEVLKIFEGPVNKTDTVFINAKKQHTIWSVDLRQNSNPVSLIYTLPEIKDLNWMLSEKGAFKRIANITCQLDMLLCYITYQAITFINEVPLKFITLGYIKLPTNLSYPAVLYFLLFLYLIRQMIRLFSRGKMSNKQIISRLNLLNERISAQITTSSNTEISVPVKPSFWKFFKNKKKTYPIADVREIEKELIDIFKDIQNLPKYNYRPEFIVIFDELDKIEPLDEYSYNFSNENEKEKPSFSLFEPDASRKRQHTIYKLLSNLKHFITSAQAKFIFIAGKEMHDAYLADVSDRNFINRSIFNTVLYIPSFLSIDTMDEIDNTEHYDITYMTEQYVCQFLFPALDMPDKYSLKEYNKYLLSINEFNHKIHENDIEKKIAQQKREKVIYFLHQFIIYLMHNSNGAPKKITGLFEKYIVDGKNIDFKNNHSKYLIAGNNYKSQYLRFDEDDQYKMGMISALLNPIIYMLPTFVKSYSDKLLVSSTFIINNIMKFHGYGFSWRNIEHTHELIEIHKTPELRAFITRIMQYMSQIHLEEIVSGLYQFKFSKKISQEISFLSKISEESSASFNFTLDESLVVRKHYQYLLSLLEERYSKAYGNEKRNEYINSIASIHMFLGDIYFYEEDLGNAIVEYMDSIQHIRYKYKSDEEIPTYDVVLILRNMLKLGLSYEKRKTYNSAFLTYSKLTSIVIKHRDIDLTEIGLETRNDNNNEVFIKAKEATDETSYHYNFENKDFNSFSDEFVFDKTELLNRLQKDLNSRKAEIIRKLSAYEGIRIFYQPLLAKFQIIEKYNLGGITLEDTKRLESEFEFIIKAIRSNEKYLIETEFWSKVADILFFKNGLSLKIEPDHSVYESCYQNRLSATKNKHKLPCFACKYYSNSLNNLLGNFIINNNKKLNKEKCLDSYYLKMVYDAIEKNQFKSTRTNSFKALANILADISNIRLSCAKNDSSISPEFINVLFSDEVSKNNFGQLLELNKNRLCKLETSIVYALLSAYFFKKAKIFKSSAYQLTKVLFIIREYIQYGLNDAKSKTLFKLCLNEQIGNIKKLFISKIISTYYKSYENIHIWQIEKFKDIFNEKNTFFANNISLKKIPIDIELEEVIFCFMHLELFCVSMYPNSLLKLLEEKFKKNLASPYLIENSMYNKVLKLWGNEQLNSKILFFHYKIEIENIFLKENISIHKTIEASIDLIADAYKINNNRDDKTFDYLISDSIYSLNEMIKIVNSFGNTSIFTHSFIGNIHYSLMNWIQLLHLYLFVKYYDGDSVKVKELFDESDTKKENRKGILNEITQAHLPKFFNDIIPAKEMSFISINYQREQAVKEYYQALETHTEGKAYNDLIEIQYYLNDDYNDKFLHFRLSQERYRMNTGIIDDRLKLLKSRYEESGIYDVDSYYQTNLSSKK